MKMKVYFMLACSACILFSCNNQKKAEVKSDSDTAKSVVYLRGAQVTSMDTAMILLQKGNQRFVDGKVLLDDLSEAKRTELKEKGQKPFAIIVTCSDSRVAPEHLFDQGIGDLFVIRTAGNIVDSVGMGSVEYGAEHLGAPLVVVLGHEKCGAVKATVDGGEAPGSIMSIVKRIAPSVAKVKAAKVAESEVLDKSIAENVKANVDYINKSSIIKKLLEEKKIKVVGAVYHLASGNVEFFQ